MSWGAGAKMLIQFWPIIEQHIEDRDERIRFTGELLKILVKGDMDPWQVEDVHADVRRAMRQVGIEITEPDRYSDDSTDKT